MLNYQNGTPLAIMSLDAVQWQIVIAAAGVSVSVFTLETVWSGVLDPPSGSITQCLDGQCMLPRDSSNWPCRMKFWFQRKQPVFLTIDIISSNGCRSRYQVCNLGSCTVLFWIDGIRLTLLRIRLAIMGF